MKTLIASAILLSSSSVLAHDNTYSSNSCSVELNGGVNITQDRIEFSKDKKPLYQIVNNEDLIVDGKHISLDAEQQALVTKYSTSIRAVVPEVKTIALDAMDLAVDGVNLAFNELLGEGNDVGQELTTELTGLRSEIERNFDQNKPIYFDEDGFEGDEFFGEEFEQRIESLVENTIQNSMGTLLIAVGQELLFSGGNMDAFEARMENFGEQIEHEMESRGEALEKRGEALCQSVVAIDDIEEQLKSAVNEISSVNFLVVDSHNSHDI